MKRNHILIILAALSSAVILVAGERRVFSSVVASIEKNQPASFSCRLSGAAIDERLASVPEDAVNPGKRAEVRLFFRPDDGHAIRVIEVDPVFVNLFSLYNAYVEMTGAYILKRGRTWEAFSRDHEMKLQADRAEAFEVRIARRGDAPDSYGVFTIKRPEMLISEVRFFNRGVFSYQVNTDYAEVSGKALPSRMRIVRILENGRRLASEIVFSDYRLNVRIPDAYFR